MTVKVNKEIPYPAKERYTLEQLIISYNSLVELVILPSHHVMHYQAIAGNALSIELGGRPFYPDASNAQLIHVVLHQTKGLLLLLPDNPGDLL